MLALVTSSRSAREVDASPPSLGGGKEPRQAQVIFDLLGHIRSGLLILRTPDGCSHAFGDAGAADRCVIAVHDWRVFPRVLRDGSLGLGESYMDGWWDVEDGDLARCMGILFRNELDAAVRRSPSLLLRSAVQYVATRPASLQHSAANVHHHYDLGNEFFRLMLGGSMTYSCGVVEDTRPLDSDANSIEAMQDRKNDLVCRKLGLREGEHLLDVGCGWGELLFLAAKRYGAIATGITLSDEQAAWIERRAKEQGLAGRVTVLRKDYREAEGTFDAFASVGMFEHVGDAHYGTFMSKVASLLKPGGKGLLHTIGWQGQSWAMFQDPWLTKYIFPGSHIPSLDRIAAEMQSAGFLIAHVENFKLHYAETLRRWKRNVDANAERIRALAPQFDERFFRMWDYYLQTCEACFRRGQLQLYQALLVNGKEWTLPLRLRF